RGPAGMRKRSSSQCSAPPTRASRIGSWLPVQRSTMVKAVNTVAALAAALLLAVGAHAAEQNAPEPPRAFVEIPQLKTTGRTIRVPAGVDLQKALDEAKGGDRIELEPRATYEGPFHLKAKDGDDWIV